MAKSRWADDPGDVAFEAQRKKDKEEKKRAKAEKLRKLQEAEQANTAQNAQSTNATPSQLPLRNDIPEDDIVQPAKRRKVDAKLPEEHEAPPETLKLLRFPAPEWGPCRHVDNFEKLNHIEEGSYGWVSRARETATGEVVALKKLKMAGDSPELPVTGLREIQTLMVARHENVVNLQEVVVGDNTNE